MNITMYAIVRTGGKQYKVRAGDTIKVEKLASEVGQEVLFPEVLVRAVENNDGKVDISFGKPLVSDSAVKGTVVAHGREEKVKIFKFRRRKHSAKSMGHRQYFTEVKIESIS